MKKRIYRKIHVNQVRAEDFAGHDRLKFAVDVAKRDMVAAIATADGKVLRTVCWQAPSETILVIALLKQLRSHGADIDVVMEPSGSYDAPLRQAIRAAGFLLYQVKGKRTHDAREVLDGVPSLHDAKCAAILAMLHRDGVSRLWEDETANRRALRAAVAMLDLHLEQLQQYHGRMESLLAKYWPELCELGDLKSVTLLSLLAEIGGPVEVRAKPIAAEKLMWSVSRGKMSRERIANVLESARTTTGVRPIPEETELLVEMARLTRETQKAVRRAEGRVSAMSDQQAQPELSALLGKVTAAVVLAEVGRPSSFSSARSFLKACGANLWERSSGTKQGQLHISKRGSPKVRRYLYLAALRLLQTDAIVRSWYLKKVERDGGKKMKAITALMRKLMKAIFVVDGGEPFDASKLFDITRLSRVPHRQPFGGMMA